MDGLSVILCRMKWTVLVNKKLLPASYWPELREMILSMDEEDDPLYMLIPDKENFVETENFWSFDMSTRAEYSAVFEFVTPKYVEEAIRRLVEKENGSD